MAKQPSEADAYPDAAKRLKPDASGTVAAAIAGQPWLFADYIPKLAPVWDRLIDANALAGRYPILDVQLAAYRLLVENYTLSDDEAVILIRAADTGDLVKAVETALLGPERAYRGYSDWVVASLASNGLTIDAIPPKRLHAVLDMLVATRRAVPLSDWVSSAQAAKVRADILAMVTSS